MKAMILAAGKGTRMLPLTETMPKPLLQAGRYSLIEHQIRKLKAQGFTDIVINHAWLGSKLEQAFGDGSALGVEISWSPEGEPLETAGGIRQALPLLGEEAFLVVNGDIWTDYPFAQLKGALSANDQAHLVLVANPPQHPGGDFALSDAGRLLQKTATSSNWTYSGIAVFHPALFRHLQIGRRALLPLLLDTIDQGKSSAEMYSGVWMDIGTPERLQQLNDILTSEAQP